MAYKIIFQDRDGREKTIEDDSYNVIRNIHHNIKYQQKLPISNILKPENHKPWFASISEVALFKKRGAKNAT